MNNKMSFSKEDKLDCDRILEYKLIIVSSDVHDVFEVPAGITRIGRDSSNEVQLLSNGVSRFHAKLINDADGVRIEDVDSSNGVFVNGKRITEPQILKCGDAIMVGYCTFRIWEADYDGPDEIIMSPDGFAEYSEAQTVRVEMHSEDSRRSGAED